MADLIQSFLHWFTEDDKLLANGAALVVISGGLWKLYLLINDKITKKKKFDQTPPPRAAAEPDKPDSMQETPPENTRRIPLLVVKGKYRPEIYPKQTRRAMIFGSGFAAFWCLALFYGSVTSRSAINKCYIPRHTWFYPIYICYNVHAIHRNSHVLKSSHDVNG